MFFPRTLPSSIPTNANLLLAKLENWQRYESRLHVLQLHLMFWKVWDHDSGDGLLNSTIMQRAATLGQDSSSFSRRSPLSVEDDDGTRDIDDLILALRGM